MSKETSLIVLGVWIIIVPYLGVPGSWRTVFLVLSGAGVATLGFLLRGEVMAKGPRVTSSRGRRASHSFVEHIPEAVETPADTAEHHDGITSLN